MNWISVEDQLPPKPGRYLIYFPTRSTSPMDALWTRDRRFVCDNIDRTETTTHWMEIPEPPTKKQ